MLLSALIWSDNKIHQKFPSIFRFIALIRTAKLPADKYASGGRSPAHPPDVHYHAPRLNGNFSMPFLFQNRILISVFIAWSSIGIIYECYKFHKQALPAHTELFTQMLTGQVIIFNISVNTPCAFHPEQIFKKSVRCFKSIAFPLIISIKHPAGTKCIMN